SVADSYGPVFLEDLSREVNRLYPQGKGYKPSVIVYDDIRGKTFKEQGRAIIDAAKGVARHGSGYGVVMIHHTSDRKKRHEDRLSGLVLRALKEECDLVVSTIHVETSRKQYAETRDTQGHRVYPGAQGKEQKDK